MTPHHFFGGDASNLGSVTQLSANTWSRFVQEVLGHPILLNVTREQFHALPKDRRNAVKRVAYVTPAAFKSSPSKRLHEHAKSISLIALDIDDPNQARPFVRTPSLLADALSPYSFAAYTTASSTSEVPKLRIFVLAAQLPVKLYPSAVRFVAEMLGLPSVTKESLVAVQPMYLPTIFRGDDGIMDHPLLIAELGGKPLTDVPVMTGKSPTDRKHEPSDDIEHLQPTSDDITLEDVRAALKHVDPDCTYPEWLEIAAALRHQFPREPDLAYQLFDLWSAKGSKYVSSDDTAAKWKSLRTTPRGRAPITVRTLLFRATAGGWDGAAHVSLRAYARVLGWIQDTRRTAAELMTQGARQIAAAPIQSTMERETLLGELRAALLAKGMKVSGPTLKKELRRMTAKATPDTKPQSDTQLPPWARGICYVSDSDEFYQRAADKHRQPKVLDSEFSVHLMSPDSETGRPTMRPQDFLLNVAKIPRVDQLRYDPAHPDQTFVSVGHHRYVNTYIPTYPEPDADDMDYAGEIFSEHVDNLITEPEYRRTVLDYLTYCVQHPGKKIRWAVLLQGTQGCGKTAIARATASVLGNSNVTIMDASLLFQPYNPWASGAQIVAMEEIRVVGHNRYEVMNRLKPCITNDTVMIRRMRTDAYQTPNMTNYLMFTNYHDSLAVGEDDRRYFVLNSTLQSKAQVTALGPKYFKRLFGVIDDHGPGLRAWFEARRISADFDPNGHAPATTYLKELANDAATPLTAAVKDALHDAAHALVRPDLVSTKVLTSLLQLDSTLPRFNLQQLGSALRELGYVRLSRPRLPDGRHYLWCRRGAHTVASGELAARNRAVGADPAVML